MSSPGELNSLVLTAQAEPIPGYRLVCPLGRGGFGQVWKCEAPGGLLKAVKVVAGGGPTSFGVEQELRALQRIKSIRHPFLLSMERVERVDGHLMIVMELADCSLFELLRLCQEQGQAGVPRDELLGYLAEAAEALDLMNFEHGLQHLDVKPQNLLLVGGHAKVADFGLVASLAEMSSPGSSGSALAAITPLYAAPENFSGKISLSSDQYSLALVYHELLTGRLPFTGKSFHTLALQHRSELPDLDRLGARDRDALARALSKEPHHRFPCCREFVQALRGEATTDAGAAPSRRIRAISPSALASGPAPTVPVPVVEVTLDDHHFLDCLGTSPLGEMWRTEAPDGTACLVKLVPSPLMGGLFGDEGPLRRLRALAHPGLVPTTYLSREPGGLALISEPPSTTLAERFQEARARRALGLRREEVLAWLRRAAATLDELLADHGLQHLGLNPRNLVLRDGELLLDDFGLVQLIWLPAGQPVAQMNARYAPPELFLDQASPSSDQYSLALIGYELMTGVHPLANRTPRQFVQRRSTGKLDLELVCGPQQRVLLKALHPDPECRFANCAELIEELSNAAVTAPSSGTHRVVRPSQIVAALPPRTTPARSMAPGIEKDVRPVREVISEVVRASAGDVQVREYHGLRYELRPGVALEHCCYVRLRPGTAPLELAGFCGRWKAQVVSCESARVVLGLPLKATLWQRLFGRRPSLEVIIQVAAPRPGQATMTDVLLRLQPVGCRPAEAQEVLQTLAPAVLESVRDHLLAGPERRIEGRLPYPVPVEVVPGEAPAHAPRLVAQGKDVSPNGVGLYLRSAPGCETMVLKLQRSAVDPVVDVPARVVRVTACDDGRYEVGLRFQVG